MSERRITFTFDGEKYSVGMEAYDEDLPIQLPNGRIIKCAWWYESLPPQPSNFQLVLTTKQKVVHATHFVA